MQNLFILDSIKAKQNKLSLIKWIDRSIGLSRGIIQMIRPSSYSKLIPWIIGIGAVSAVALAATLMKLPVSVFTMDIATISDHHPLTGILSNLGILLWCSCASVCLFSSLLLYRYKSKKLFFFLLASGFVTTLLLLDDLFLFHEVLGPGYIGVPERGVLASLAIVGCTYLIVFRHYILKTEYSHLSFSLACFAISLFVDETPLPINSLRFLIEDGFKFLGITLWCSYFLRTSFSSVVGAARQDSTSLHEFPGMHARGEVSKWSKSSSTDEKIASM